METPLSPDHGARGHHPLGPSGTNYRDPRIGGCLGFVNRQNDTNTAAEEGTENHETLDLATREWVKHDCEGSITDFFPGELTDQTLAWTSFVASKIEQVIKTADQVHPELCVVLRRDDGSEINFGHLDLLCINGASGTLDDYKFGWVPVKPASINRQGWNYAAAVFQMFPGLMEITVRFIQPKHSWVTEHTYYRVEDADRLRVEIDQLNQQSLEVRESRDPDRMNPGSACEYCALAGNGCAAYLRHFDLARQKMGVLPELNSWSAETMSTPEEAAAAKAWMAFFEIATAEVSRKCLEIARATEGGIIAVDDFEFKVASKRGQGQIPDLHAFLEVLEASGVPRPVLEPHFSISKSTAVSVATNHLKATSRSSDTKKAISEELDTTLKVTGAYIEGQEYDYLRKVNKAKK